MNALPEWQNCDSKLVRLERTCAHSIGSRNRIAGFVVPRAFHAEAHVTVERYPEQAFVGPSQAVIGWRHGDQRSYPSFETRHISIESMASLT